MKKCSRCKETKEVSAFSKDKAQKDGYQNNCKACSLQFQREWRKKNKEKMLEWQRNYRAKAKPCVYRIKHKQDGRYYLGQTKRWLFERTDDHFSPNYNPSPFTGLNKDDWDVEVLCYGTAKEVRQLEKALLRKRVGIDPNCLNKNR